MASRTVTCASHQLWDAIVATGESATRACAVSDLDTAVELVCDGSVSFVVRVARSLRDKPKAAATGKPQVNPFLPPEPALTVCSLEPAHTLVLNRFRVVRHHVLVITRAFEPQTEQLSAADLAAAWPVLLAFPRGGLLFLNVGEASGFSQAHKHMQLLPLPLGPELDAPAVPIEPLLLAAASPEGVSHVRSLPFWNVCALLPPDATPTELAGVLEALLQNMRSAFPGLLSYNVLSTARWLMVVPRRAEAGCGVAVNALAFAGTILCRSAEELAVVRAGPARILAEAGQPWGAG